MTNTAAEIYRTRLPQRHCYHVADHAAHDWRPNLADTRYTHRCPGRRTPRGLTSGAYGDPRPTDDPFAGIE